MKFFLTGASGFIGSQLLKELLSAGQEVLSVSRGAIPSVQPGANWLHHPADITCWGSFEEQVRNFAPDACIHAAWAQTHDYSEKACRINLLAGVNLLNFCFSLPSVKSVSALGSCLEYGNTQAKCREDLSPAPETYFAWCKQSLHTYGRLQAAQADKSFNWLRVFYAYGPKQRSGALIPSVLQSLSEGRAPALKNPGMACDFVHVTDVARGILRASTRTSTGCLTLNLGGGRAYTAGSVADFLAATWKGETDLPALKATETGMRSDNTQILKCLNWEPTTELHSGLKKLVQEKKSAL